MSPRTQGTDQEKLQERLEAALGLSSRNDDEKKRGIEECLGQLARDLSFQQFLYDTELIKELRPNLSSCLALFADDRTFDPRSRLVLYKLVAHEFYAERKLWPTAVRLMCKAVSLLSRDETPLGPLEGEFLRRWYRIFLLDHASNRMVAPDEADDRRNLNQEVEATLPASLVDVTGSTSIPGADLPFALRAAHYWGHRGNVALTALQDVTREDLNASSERPRLRGLVAEGEAHFRRAIRLRVVALRYSFPGFKLKRLEQGLQKWSPASDLPMALESPETTERLWTPTQGIADLANQFGGIACLLCHAHAIEPDRLEEIAEARALNRALWEVAHERSRSWDNMPKSASWKHLAAEMESVLHRVGSPFSNALEGRQADILDRFRRQVNR